MSVAVALNLDHQFVQGLIRDRWAMWCVVVPALAQVPDSARLKEWLRATSEEDPESANDVLLAMAELAAKDGADDEAAATVLAWLMLPAAAHLAWRLSYLSPDIDRHVAAQLWIEVRQYTWRNGTKVAAGVAGRLRKAVVADLTSPTLIPGEDLDHVVGAFTAEFDRPSEAMERLLSVLEVGCDQGVITSEERLLLLDIIVAAAGDPNMTDGYALLGDEVSTNVAVQWGMSPRTIRRKASAAISRLSQLNCLAAIA